MKKYEVDGAIETDSTSFIYVKKKKYEDGSKHVIHLLKEQWEATCKIDDFPDEGEQPVFESDDIQEVLNDKEQLRLVMC